MASGSAEGDSQLEDYEGDFADHQHQNHNGSRLDSRTVDPKTQEGPLQAAEQVRNKSLKLCGNRKLRVSKKGLKALDKSESGGKSVVKSFATKKSNKDSENKKSNAGKSLRESLRVSALTTSKAVTGIVKTARESLQLMKELRPAHEEISSRYGTRNHGTKDSEIVRFKSIRANEVVSFWTDLVRGQLAEDVELATALHNIDEGLIREGQTLQIADRDGEHHLMCCSALSDDPVRIHKSAAKLKAREDWTTEDVILFVILPLVKDTKGFFMDLLPPEAVGGHFQGTFVCHSHNIPMRWLANGIKSFCADQRQPLEETFVWLDVFSSNHKLLAHRSDDHSTEARRQGLVRTGVHEAISRFESVLIILDTWDKPLPFRRAWCVWEIFGAALHDKPTQIALGNENEGSLLEWLLANQGGEKLVQAMSAISMHDMQCRDIFDLQVIRIATENLEGGFSSLKSKVLNHLTRWLLAESQRIIAHEECESYDPHTDLEYANICMLIGTFRYQLGDLDSAMDALGRSFKTYYQNKGSMSQGARAVIEKMADVRRDQGHYNEAIEMYNRILKFDQHALGDTHPLVAETLNNLALIQERMGHYTAALEYYQEVLAIRKSALGDQDLKVADVINNMAIVHYMCAEYDAALHLFEEAVAIYQKTELDQAQAQQAVADALSNMGDIHKEQGRLDEALDLFTESLQIKRSVLGSQHPSVANTLVRMGETKILQDEFPYAISLLQEAIDIYQDMYGSEHVLVADSLTCLAEAKQGLGDTDEAMRLTRLALHIKQKVLHKTHPSIASDLYNLSVLHYTKGDTMEALSNAVQAEQIWRRAVGVHHPLTLRARKQVALLMLLLDKE